LTDPGDGVDKLESGRGTVEVEIDIERKQEINKRYSPGPATLQMIISGINAK